MQKFYHLYLPNMCLIKTILYELVLSLQQKKMFQLLLGVASVMTDT